jgi:hypothetical protein
VVVLVVDVMAAATLAVSAFAFAVLGVAAGAAAVMPALASLRSTGDVMGVDGLFAANGSAESELVNPAMTVRTPRASREPRGVPAANESCCGAAEFSDAAGSCPGVESVLDDVAPAVVSSLVPEFEVFVSGWDPSRR